MAVSAGKLYRWVDEDGEVHYGDRMPADASRNEHAVMDESGVVREQRRSADDEAAERERARAEEEGSRAQAEAQERHDRMLLETFASEEELLRMRDRRVEAVDARIAVVEHQLEDLRAERREHQAHLDSIRSATTEDAPARKMARRRIDRTEQRIEQVRARLETLEAQREEIEERFAADLERFRELEAARRE